jgi:hypothetical protein
MLALLAAGCGREGRRARQEADSARAGIAVDPRTVAGRIALELWQLRGALTLGEWSGSNLNDQIVGADSSAIGAVLGEWCAVGVRRIQMGARAVERRVYFYPPPPDGFALPDSASPDLVRECRLGLVWVRVPVPDSAAAGRLADSVRTQLAAAFRRADSGGVSFFGSAFWSVVGRFHRDSLTVVSALRAPPFAATSADSGPNRDVVALAFLPSSGVSIDPETPRGLAPYPEPDTVSLDSVARTATRDTALWAALRRALGASRERGMLPADSLVRPLRRWLEASRLQPPPRRAAMLFVADEVLQRAMCGYHLCELADSTQQRPLRALGAALTFSPLGGTWNYERTWLAEARVLDRDSPLGQHILLLQLAAAFDFSGTCRGGSDGFRRVIDNGERYLARAPDSPVAADVHVAVGDAYRDIVALARGAGDVYADSSRYSAEAPVALERALEHYRAAIRAAPGSAAARAAWRRAWWLLAGLAPRDVRFYCIYD